MSKFHPRTIAKAWFSTFNYETGQHRPSNCQNWANLARSLPSVCHGASGWGRRTATNISAYIQQKSIWSFNSRCLRCPHLLSPGHQETQRFLLASCTTSSTENSTACFQALPLGQGCSEVHAIYSVLMLLQHTHAVLVMHNISFPPTMIWDLFISKLMLTLVIHMSTYRLFSDLSDSPSCALLCI